MKSNPQQIPANTNSEVACFKSNFTQLLNQINTYNTTTLNYVLDFLETNNYKATDIGYVFEKLNGGEHGGLVTPRFVSAYMCRETIRKVVIQKFNQEKGWACNGFNNLKEHLCEAIKQGDKLKEIKHANDIVNSLKICDPAVGSGHFLVAALNEVIAIKSELSILVDKDINHIDRYLVKTVNDELQVFSKDNGECLQYNPKNKESQRIQETLFHEKQSIIENCLFGVDINHFSVKLSRIRLSIELLKSAYYIQDQHSKTVLHPLPRIDHKIKQGNSLVSRFNTEVYFTKILRRKKVTAENFLSAIEKYKEGHQLSEFDKLVKLIKDDSNLWFASMQYKTKCLQVAKSELRKLQRQTSIFDLTNDQITNHRVFELEKDIVRLEKEIEDIKANTVFENSFEWRFEFPELLNHEGSFEGFDCVIGNPSYTGQEKFEDIQSHLKANYKTDSKYSELYVYFLEKGITLLKDNGWLAYTIPNNWDKKKSANTIQAYLVTQANYSTINACDVPCFEDIYTYPSILMACKKVSEERFVALLLECQNQSKKYFS